MLCKYFFTLKERTSPSLRLRVLNVVKLMLSRTWKRLEGFSLDWEPYWEEVMGLLQRKDRYEVTASETALSDFTKGLAAFIMDSRHYFTPTNPNKPSALGNLVDAAMKKLSDLRNPASVEGLLLLTACLPSDYAHYDAILPQLLTKWAAIDHNMDWDYCWIKVLSRARKHSKSFDWAPVLPFLLTKLRQLLNLPSVVSQKAIRGHSFPRSFPGYFVHFFLNNKDTTRQTIMKISKIVLHIVNTDTTQRAAELLSLSLPQRSLDQLSILNLKFQGFNHAEGMVSSAAVELAMFIQSLRSYMHPSNQGDFVFNIASFVLSLIRQICKLVGTTVAANFLSLQQRAVHWPTLHYLMGLVLSVTIEGLYTKNNSASRSFLVAVKHLFVLEPLYAHALLPPMLYTLDVGTLSPSSHALVTMQSLSSCFHTMLFPNPVVLQYLPDLLRMTLPGLDASDASKSTITLDLYSNILSRLPITAEPSVLFTNLPSYTAIAEGQMGLDAIRSGADAVLEGHLSAVMEYMANDWAAALLERVFVLIDGLEVKVKGVKASPIIGGIGLCVGLLLQAVSPDMAVRQELIEMITSYTLTKAPVHTAKACAKLLDNVLSTTPTDLPAILAKVLQDIDLTRNSAEKVAFRLRLASGCVRYAQATNIVECLHMLEPVLCNKEYIHHEEKEVRKCLGKLAKDMFKGAMAIYPMGIKPAYAHQNVLGEPNQTLPSDVQWHSPDAKSLEKVVAVLQKLTTACATDIRNVLDKATGATSTTDAAANGTAKKAEDVLANSLTLLKRILRGTADLLGDALPEDVDPNDTSNRLIYTTRQAVLSSLSPETAAYLASYRNNVLQLLVDVQDSFASIPKDSVLFALLNNIVVTKQWLKIVEIIYNKRMANLKDVDGCKKWFSYSKQIATNMVAAHTYKLFKKHQPEKLYEAIRSEPNGLGEKLGQILFWKHHNVDTNTIACSVWLQEIVRYRQLSFKASRIAINTVSSNVSDVMQCDESVGLEANIYNVDVFATRNVHLLAVKHVLALSRHEYDAIRPVARKTFNNINHKLSSKLNIILFNVIKLLHIPNASYYQTASTLVILNNTKNIAKIANNVHLKVPFLSAIQNIYQTAMSITENDKSEKIMASLAEIFVNYAYHWAHRYNNIALLYENILKPLLGSMGGNGSSNLRMDTFQSYLLLHLMGSPLLVYHAEVLALFKHTLQVLSSHHGQPTQSIALASLCRLAELAYQSNKTNGQPAWFSEAQALFALSSWKSLITGLCRCHPKADEDHSQWSSGIDQIMQTSLFLRITKPRAVSNKCYDQNIYSTLFRREVALMVANLVHSGLLDVSTDSNLLAFLELTKDVPCTSETETRAANTTRAEIFCGLLKARNESGQDVALLKGYLLEQTEGISMDYCKEWQEGICLAYDGAVGQDVLVAHFLDAFGANLRTEVMDVEDSKQLDEGFARQGKIFMFISALLHANYIASTESTYSTASAVLQCLASAETNVIISYSTSRAELSSIINTLLRCYALRPEQAEQFSAISAKMMKQLNGSSSISRNVIEEVAMMFSVMLMRLTLPQSMAQVLALFPSIVHGITHAEADVNKMSTEAVRFLSHAIVPTDALRGQGDYLNSFLSALVVHSKNASWKVRDSIIKGSVTVMMQNWNILSSDEKKSLKDVYAEALLDAQLEVQATAQSAMVAYLSYKTQREMKSIAEAYVRNSDSFLIREKNKRKAAKADSAQEKPDKAYMNTVFMMACVILAFPYDMPSFLPPLLTSFIRHSHSDVLKAVISRTVQSFKRTHQDRWEQDYKKAFTVEQLEALQGAGAAHYFS